MKICKVFGEIKTIASLTWSIRFSFGRFDIGEWALLVPFFVFIFIARANRLRGGGVLLQSETKRNPVAE